MATGREVRHAGGARDVAPGSAAGPTAGGCGVRVAASADGGAVVSCRLTKLERRTALVRLYQAEGALRRRCAIVAARLELAASAMVLLEVACHADASLDDLDTLADARGIVVLTLTSRVRSWFNAVVGWVVDLWPVSAARVYGAVLVEMQANAALASSLRRACLASSDVRAADWCDLWEEQRAALASRLGAALAEAPPQQAVEAGGFVT
jgi:hypothetical protein